MFVDPMAFLNAEDQLLYLCSLPRPNDLGRETLTFLSARIQNWDRLLEKVAYHKLQPRFYSFLKRNDAPAFLDPPVWRKIESAYRWAQAYVMAHEGELGILLPLMNWALIPVLLLKGAALLQTVYREKPIRFLVDLDLLVHPRDLDRVKTILQTAGFHARLDHLPSQWHEQQVYSGPERVHFPFVHPERKIYLDLHLEAFEPPSPFHLKPDWLWEGARLIPLGPSQAFLPSPTNLFLHLLFHLAGHAAAQQNVFGWYLDLDECLRFFAEQIDGRLVREVIGSSARRDELLKILALIDYYFSSPFPEEIKSLLGEGEVKPPPLEVIFSSSEKSELAIFNHPEGLNRREQFLSYWGQVSGFRKKSLFLLRWLLPDRDYLEKKYPFRTFREKGVAYLKHFVTLLLKGISLGGYVLKKGPLRVGDYSSLIRKRA